VARRRQARIDIQARAAQGDNAAQKIWFKRV
jgi:hypothetical protein